MWPRLVCQGSVTEEVREMRTERWVGVKRVKRRKMLAKGPARVKDHGPEGRCALRE